MSIDTTEGMAPVDSQSEALTKHVINPQIREIFDCLRASLIAGERDQLDHQLEALIAFVDTLEEYEDSLMNCASLKEFVGRLAEDEVVVDWAIHQIECGNYDFDVSDAEPIPPEDTEEEKVFTFEESERARREHIEGKIQRYTGRSVWDLDSPGCPIEKPTVITAILRAGSNPAEKLHRYKERMVKSEDLVEKFAEEHPFSQAA